ncbi:unnamed protein product [Mycena citricolor]|uniref:O-methyltransferase C-terminal domain-containing protein n=1 Tax=Mycena citricolor TaxID=2018698 RepID=A0AAD2HIH4_9AGAR|nr:unnamed protein product [Mycena citricolor]
MTFAELRALHEIVGNALDEIERVYVLAGRELAQGKSVTQVLAQRLAPDDQDDHEQEDTSGRVPEGPLPLNGHRKTASRVYASPPPSPGPGRPIRTPAPSLNTSPASTPDSYPNFPSLHKPYTPTSPSEQLTAHPLVAAACSRIVSASSQLAASVQHPFLSLCDASMGYNLPSCLRVFEGAHVAEILRDKEEGVKVEEIESAVGATDGRMAHILRLLATHHIVRETAPNVFATNRISSLIDTGKDLKDLLSHPERKYDGDGETSGIAAFVGMCTDELHKSSAYLMEAVLPGAQRVLPALSACRPTPSGTEGTGVGAGLNIAGESPTRAPFNLAFGCEGIGYFGWLEGEGLAGRPNPSASPPPPPPVPIAPLQHARMRLKSLSGHSRKSSVDVKALAQAQTTPAPSEPRPNPNSFRLERFGKAMAGTASWESPGSVFQGFDWGSLPRGSVVVDVGGGIGSTTMLLATAFAGADGEEKSDFEFVIQDRPFVVAMGEKAWRDKCPELLDSGAVRFQVHDFFTPQPITNAAVFFLRVVLHDWPDAFAQRILLRLREAATPDTKLVLGDFVLPLACVDDFNVADGRDVEGAENLTMMAPAPLLANLGKASANGYWMDLTMQVMFNGKERTLREIVALALSAGWQVVRVNRPPGWLFGHIVAVPVAVPIPAQRRARAGSGSAFFDSKPRDEKQSDPPLEILAERAGSRCGTPTFGSRLDLPFSSVADARAKLGSRRPWGARSPPPSIPLRGAAIPGKLMKKRPSPLTAAAPTAASSPSPSSTPQPGHDPRATILNSPVTRKIPSSSKNQKNQLLAPQSPISPRFTISRRSSLASLAQQHSPSPPPPVPPLLVPPTPLRSSNVASTATPPRPPKSALRHMPSSPVLKQKIQQQQPSPPSPVPSSRLPSLTRRASHAQLSPRSEQPRSPLLLGRSLGGAIDFGAIGRKLGYLNRGRETDAESSSVDSDGRNPPTSLLAEAATIEGAVGARIPSPYS